MRLTMSVSFAATCFNGSQFRPLIPLLEAMPKELGASLHDMLNLITGNFLKQHSVMASMCSIKCLNEKIVKNL